MSRRIFTIGGHDFTRRPEDQALNDFIVSLVETPSPKICLLPTASGDADDQIARFNTAMLNRGALPTVISLFRLGEGPVPVRERLLSQDIIYVGGGSLVNLMAIWLAHGLAEIMAEAWDAGIVICGQSAGALCWFEEGVTKSSGQLGRAVGMGLLEGSACVHYHAEPDRRAYFLSSVGDDMPAGFGIDDHAGLLWEERRLAQVVSANTGTAYRVEQGADGPEETALEAELLERRQPPVAQEIAEFRRHNEAKRRAGYGRSGSPAQRLRG